MTDTRWTQGLLIGLPVLALVIVGLWVLVAFLFRWWRNQREYGSDGDAPLALGFAIGGTLAAIASTIGVAAGYYPYKAEYHQWRPVHGQVTAVSARLVGGDSTSVTQKFVVLLDGNPQEYGCDDTRCALIKPGDTLDLSCLRSWQYASTSGYDCRFVRRS